MTDPKPPALEPAVGAGGAAPYWRRNLSGLTCFALGVASLVAAAIMVMSQDAPFEASPDLRVIVPLWIAAAVAFAATVVRREDHLGFAVAGVAMASAALALAWVLVLAAVAAGALIVIYVISEVF